MGKSAGAPPDSPDYAKLIPVQSAANMQQFQQMLQASRANSFTPYGSSTWEKTPSFDQAGYDAAMKKYSPGSQGTWVEPSYGWTATGEWGAIPGRWDGASGPSGEMPTKDQFTTYDWSNTQSLSPEQQKLYDLNVSSQQQQAGLLSGLGQQIGQATKSPLNFSGAPSLTGSVSPSSYQTPTFANGFDTSFSPRDIASIMAQIQGADPKQFAQEAADAQYGAATRYLAPAQEQQTRQAEARLAQQGFVPGTPAYDQAMSEIRKTQDMALADARDRSTMLGANVGSDQYRNLLSGLGLGFNTELQRAQFGAQQDARGFDQRLIGANLERAQTQDANSIADRLFSQNLQAGEFGNRSRQQSIAELLMRRQQPINEYSAIRSGAQVQGPNTQQQYSTPALQGIDQIGLAQQGYANQLGGYNAEVGTANAQNAQTGQIASLLAMFLMGSDRRLKTNIKRVGTSPRGYPWYTFDWRTGGSSQGVMADEVDPAITQVDENGYLMVDYSKV